MTPKTRTQLAHAATVLVSFVLVLAAGMFIVNPPHRGFQLSSLLAGASRPQPGDASSPLTPRCLPPESFDGPGLPPDEFLPTDRAGCDNIVVEVAADGTLSIYGEQIPLERFQALLGARSTEPLPTRITIRPHDDCVFRHIGPVIALCEENGIAHSTEASMRRPLPGIIRPGL